MRRAKIGVLVTIKLIDKQGREGLPVGACRGKLAGGEPGNMGPQGHRCIPDTRILPQNAPKVRYQTVTDDENGQRIDNFLLATLKGVPRSHIYRLITSGQVRRNGGRIKPRARLETGDEIRIPPVRTAADSGPPPAKLVQQAAACIIEDAPPWILVDKPVGLAVHAGSGVQHGLVEALRAHFDLKALDLCHRLDRDTSGIMLLARNRKDRNWATDCFRAGRAEKQYLAVLHGNLRATQTVDAPLDMDNRSDGERTVIVSEQGKRAVSHFEPLAQQRGLTLARVRIETGRTHQIRVHAAHIGLPVVGDRKYGDARADAAVQPGRMCLHAETLLLRNADGSTLVRGEAAPPPQFNHLLETAE